MKLSDTLRILEIEDILEEANRVYDETGENGIPESEYNSLMKELEEIDPTNSLINRVASSKVSSTGKVRHKKLMLSLEKVYTIEDLTKWMNKVARSPEERFVVMPKYDGIAGRFKDGVLSTRGDGEEGENISHRIPLIDFYEEEYDGELLITDDMFEKIVKESLITRKDGTPFKNSRNAVSGILSSEYDISWNRSGFRLIQFMPYHFISIETTIPVIEETITTLKEQFKGYPTDGIVVKLADEQYAESLGYTLHHYKHSIALKEDTETVQTVLKDVEFQVAKNHIGIVGILEPVEISGVTVSRVSLHNIDFIKSHNLKIGDGVIIKRAGEVIPHLVGSLGGGTEEIKCIKCPSCGSDVTLDGQFYKCINPNCSDMEMNKIVSAIKLLGIKGIAKSTVEKLYNIGLISNIVQLLNVTEDQLVEAGWKEGSKSLTNILKELKRVKHAPIKFSKVFAALNIEGFSTGLFDKIFKEMIPEDLMDLLLEDPQKSIKILEEIPNMSTVRATQLVEGYDSKLLMGMLDNLTIDVSLKTVAEDLMDSRQDVIRTICFTGKMPDKRSDLEELAEQKGYHPVKSVNKNLDILVVEDPSIESSKLKKADKYGVKIISRNEFYKIIDK